MGKLVSGVVLMVFTAISLAFVFPTDVEWKTDYEASKKVAVSESKYILLSFSGSDWCSNCIRLEKTLFSLRSSLNSLVKVWYSYVPIFQ